jgi:excisionase family DNA binding protein
MVETHDQSVILTRAETARLLKVSLQTLYNWTKAGLLSGYKIGNRTVYYRYDEVIDSLKKFNYKD